MKVKVISVFRGKFTGKYYSPGEVIEVSEESRVLDMENRRLAERLEVKAPEEKKEVEISLFEKEFAVLCKYIRRFMFFYSDLNV